MAKLWHLFISLLAHGYIWGKRMRERGRFSQKAKAYLPPSGKVLDAEELKLMLEASFEMWLTSGRFNQRFEKDFAHYLGVPSVFTTNSGSSANLLALASLTSPCLGERRLRPGDEVITPAAAFPTTVAPIWQLGLVPVFIDCLPTGNLDPAQLERAYSPQTKAVLAAHLLGHPFALSAVKSFCLKHNLWLIEDACDALGAKAQGKMVGTWGDLATFSFYPAHHITMGEGGAVAINNPLLGDIVRSLRDWGRDCHCPPGKDNCCGKRFSGQFGKLPLHYDHKYVYGHLGFNFKTTDWAAAIGCAQLKKLPRFLQTRKENAAYLTAQLASLRDYLILPTEGREDEASWFGYMVGLTERGLAVVGSKENLVEALEARGIGTRPIFAGNLLRQPLMAHGQNLRIIDGPLRKAAEISEADLALLAQTDRLMERFFWVGVYPGLGPRDLAQTAAAFKMIFAEQK